MKQTIEIEVPEGKKAVWENNQVKFVDTQSHWESITTFTDAYWYCYNYERFAEYIAACNHALADTYEEKIAKLRLVIAALTNNEKLSLTSGSVYYPALQLYKADYLEPIIGKDMIGTIITEGEKYIVISAAAHTTCLQGLGEFTPDCPISCISIGINIGLSSKEIADHLTKYFGKLLFEVMYGMCNCEWEWVE